MRATTLGVVMASMVVVSGGTAAADFPSTWIELDEHQNIVVIGARVSGVLHESGGAKQDDLLCEYDAVWGTFCWITVEQSTFGCGASDTILPSLTSGTQVEFRFSGGPCVLSFQQSPAYMAESLSIKSSAGGQANFVCAGDCLNAIPLATTTSSSHLGGSAWYVVESGPINGWQLSDGAGRTVTVNGSVVSPGQVPLTANAEGKYYFHFSAGDYSWSTWSWW